jgi:hypothetical protein
MIQGGGARQPTRERAAWLGDALAIKEPTAAMFRRQTGSHLLVIGQNADAARAILASSCLSLVAQQAAEERDDLPAITIFDGSPNDDPESGYLSRLSQLFPDEIRVIRQKQLTEGLNRLCDELERRKADPALACPPRFLIVNGLHRFRDLRKAEDEFGFSRKSDSQGPSPAEQFAELTREGPAHGIHVLVWCDTLANVQRAIDRRDLREFEQRVLFQMGVADSSTLVDSPIASRLGLNRALLATEEMSAPEKFRPYRLPDETYLAWAAERLARVRSGKVEATAT